MPTLTWGLSDFLLVEYFELIILNLEIFDLKDVRLWTCNPQLLHALLSTVLKFFLEEFPMNAFIVTKARTEENILKLSF